VNIIAQSFLHEAMDSLDEAMIALENHADNGPPSLVGDAYRRLLQVRGQLAAMRQIVELSQAIQCAPTERAPSLRIVR
jgi:hypothetical protein